MSLQKRLRNSGAAFVLVAACSGGAVAQTAVVPPAVLPAAAEPSAIASFQPDEPGQPGEPGAAQGQTAPGRTRRPPPAAYSKTGYIDSAIVGSQARFRLDLGFNNTRPDRGEFFWGKCGCYRQLALDPLAPGPAAPLAGGDPQTTPFIESSVDHVDLWFSAEYRVNQRFSGFVEGLIRSTSPQIGEGGTGVGDLTVGLKAVILERTEEWVTFQLKTTLPTGDPVAGRSTGNTSWEPGILYLREIAERATVAGELRAHFPVGGSSDDGVAALSGGQQGGGGYASTVIRYGIGGSYDINPGYAVVVTPVVELVGWSAVNGYAIRSVDGTLATLAVESAERTIVNLKLGARLAWDRYPGSVYVGWGTTLTSAWWYENIVRFEYRHAFF
jgi:hypothetical protein